MDVYKFGKRNPELFHCRTLCRVKSKFFPNRIFPGFPLVDDKGKI